MVSIWIAVAGAILGSLGKNFYDYRKWLKIKKETPAEFLPRVEHLKVGKGDFLGGALASLFATSLVGFLFLGLDFTPPWEILNLLTTIPDLVQAYRYAFIACLFIGWSGDYILDKFASQADVQVFDIKGIPSMTDIGAAYGFEVAPKELKSDAAVSLEQELEALPWIVSATIINTPRGPGTMDVFIHPKVMPMTKENRIEAENLIVRRTPAYVNWTLKEPDFLPCNFKAVIKTTSTNPDAVRTGVEAEIRKYVNTLEVGQSFAVSRAIYYCMNNVQGLNSITMLTNPIAQNDLIQPGSTQKIVPSMLEVLIEEPAPAS